MKKVTILFALLVTASIAFAQSKTVNHYIKHADVVNIGTIDSTGKKSTVKTNNVQFPNVAKGDSVKIAAADLKSIIGAYSEIVNNSSDISTKQANNINKNIAAFYFKYFPNQNNKP